MLRLCGFTASNYYNKVKLALLEKGIPFEEQQVFAAGSEAHLAHSPMGKVPFLLTPAGALAESQAIIEYLEDSQPQPALYPSDVFARAKCRELIQIIELYLEWAARRLYPAAFFGGSVSEDTRNEVYAALQRGMRAFARVARFAPYVAGSTLTYADCAAVVHLPTVGSTTKIIYGEDMLQRIPGVDGYLAMMRQRPHVAAVNQARKAGMEQFLAYRRSVQEAKAAAQTPRPAP